MDARLLPLLIVIAALCASSAASARDRDLRDRDLRDCDSMTLVDANVVGNDGDNAKANDDSDGNGDGDQAVVDAPEAVLAEVVVPCTLAENGTLGPACQDAPFYVVNHNGTLLCRVEFTSFANGAPVPMVETAPAAPAAGSPVVAVGALPTLSPPPPPPVGCVFLSLGCADLLGTGDAHTSDWPRPS